MVVRNWEKRSERQGRPTDRVAAGHKRDAAAARSTQQSKAKWTLPIMSLPLGGDKSPRRKKKREKKKKKKKTCHLKASRLSSLIPAGGLGCAEPLPEHCALAVCSRSNADRYIGGRTNPEKKKKKKNTCGLSAEHNTWRCGIIIGTPCRGMWEGGKGVGGGGYGGVPLLRKVRAE